jgi:glycogen debranching enzyme
VTGDADFACLTYGVLKRTAEDCIREEYDPEDGLFRGPAVYGDGVSAYPPKYRNPSLSSSILRWPGEHPGEWTGGGGIPMKALSTNCAYEHAFRVTARLAAARGVEGSGWTRRADAQKAAIRRVFRNPDTGLFDYLAYECDAQEGLGLAFAILFGITDGEETRSILDHAYMTGQGIPCVWPAFPPYREMGFGRHCGTVWPHIQGFWALAALKAGRRVRFETELHALARNAARDGQFAEIYHPEDGRIYGGIQDGLVGYIEWKSCSWQTWSAAAFLAMVLYGVCGLDEAGRKGTPFLPEGIAFAKLSPEELT